jgi:hypothetical protein
MTSSRLSTVIFKYFFTLELFDLCLQASVHSSDTGTVLTVYKVCLSVVRCLSVWSCFSSKLSSDLLYVSNELSHILNIAEC